MDAFSQAPAAAQGGKKQKKKWSKGKGMRDSLLPTDEEEERR
jgi:ribosomal protein S25